MTQPIQEPSTPRDVSGLTWGQRQLARRPAPPPPTTTGANQWPFEAYELLHWDLWNNLDGTGSPFFGNDILFPGDTGTPDYINGWRFGDSRNNANFLCYLRLGPKGSIWGINFLCDLGSDFGKVDFYWQTQTENATGQGYQLDGLNALPGSTEVPGGVPTFYKVPVGNTFDAYSPGSTQHNQVYGYSQFRIMGDDGAVITSDATGSADPVYDFNGGAGIWVLRVRTNGHNASSSGYRTRLESLIVRRITSDGFYAG